MAEWQKPLRPLKSGRLTPLRGLRTADAALLKHAALVFADDHATGLERPLENRKRFLRVGISAHEDIERRITALRPCMHADMTLRQHRNAGNSAALSEGMQMNVQKRCACGI